MPIIDLNTSKMSTANMAKISKLRSNKNVLFIPKLSLLNAFISICFLDWLWAWSVTELLSLPPLGTSYCWLANPLAKSSKLSTSELEGIVSKG